MSLARAVADFLVAWNDDLPRRQLAPHVTKLMDALLKSGKSTAPVGRPRISDEIRHRVLELHAQGNTQVEIAKAAGVSQVTVSRIVRANANRTSASG